MSSINITNPNNFTFDEKYAATHAVYNEKNNSQQEVNNEIINSCNHNQNQEEANNIQMGVNQKQQEDNNSNKNQNLINYISDLYNVNLYSNKSQNNNLASCLYQLLQIEIRKLSQSGQSSNPSAGLKSKGNNLVPQSKGNGLNHKSTENNLVF